jgi:hypothetical protein
MNLINSPRSYARSASSAPTITRRARNVKCYVPLALTWSHSGVLHRVTHWPDVQFERLYGTEWIAIAPSAEALATAAKTLTTADWQPYLEFVPAAVREFMAPFAFARLEALQVAARCPALIADLAETPALTAFVSAHVELRGSPAPRWTEINAIHERNGIFGILEWLGLPASRQTLAILRNVVQPNLPRRFLEPLRSMLWEPKALTTLQKTPALTDRQLSHYIHALAA